MLAKVRCEGAEASIVVPRSGAAKPGTYPDLLELADDIVYYQCAGVRFVPTGRHWVFQSGGPAALGNSGGAHPAARIW
jgi:hypothetical protein